MAGDVDPLDAFVAAVVPLFASGPRNGAPSWKLSGERLSDGTVRLTVRNVAKSQAWQVDMSKPRRASWRAG